MKLNAGRGISTRLYDWWQGSFTSGKAGVGWFDVESEGDRAGERLEEKEEEEAKEDDGEWCGSDEVLG